MNALGLDALLGAVKGIIGSASAAKPAEAGGDGDFNATFDAVRAATDSSPAPRSRFNPGAGETVSDATTSDTTSPDTTSMISGLADGDTDGAGTGARTANATSLAGASGALTSANLPLGGNGLPYEPGAVEVRTAALDTRTGALTATVATTQASKGASAVSGSISSGALPGAGLADSNSSPASVSTNVLSASISSQASDSVVQARVEPGLAGGPQRAGTSAQDAPVVSKQDFNGPSAGLSGSAEDVKNTVLPPFSSQINAAPGVQRMAIPLNGAEASANAAATDAESGIQMPQTRPNGAAATTGPIVLSGGHPTVAGGHSGSMNPMSQQSMTVENQMAMASSAPMNTTAGRSTPAVGGNNNARAAGPATATPSAASVFANANANANATANATANVPGPMSGLAGTANADTHSLSVNSPIVSPEVQSSGAQSEVARQAGVGQATSPPGLRPVLFGAASNRGNDGDGTGKSVDLALGAANTAGTNTNINGARESQSPFPGVAAQFDLRSQAAKTPGSSDRSASPSTGSAAASNSSGAAYGLAATAAVSSPAQTAYGEGATLDADLDAGNVFDEAVALGPRVSREANPPFTDPGVNVRAGENGVGHGVSSAAASTSARPGDTSASQLLNLPDMDLGPDNTRFPAEFVARLRLMQFQGSQEARLNLHPAELGRMQISISTEGDSTRVAFTVDNPQAREAIEQAMPRLREMLSQGGLDLVDGSVSQQDPGGRGFASEGDDSSARSLAGVAGNDDQSHDESTGDQTRQPRTPDPDRMLDAYV